MESPTSQIIADVSAGLIASDERGRTLCLRRVSALDRLRLFKAIGPELAENAPYLGMALLAISVMSIDGVPVPLPVSEGLLEALIQRLGDAGLMAISDAWNADAAGTMELTQAGN